MSGSRTRVAPRRADGPRSPWVARHRIAVFVVLAFALSWWPWPLAVAHPGSAAMLPFGPVIAALVVTAFGHGSGGMRLLARSVVRWRASRSTWVVAALGPFAVAAITGLAAVSLGIVAPTGVRD